ncbi:MAG TPA: hypothetical protein VF804_00735 [Holophagaceae bacterium]
MALRLQFLTVIVPRSAFARCPDLPPWMGTLPPAEGFFLDTCWFDPDLWCETSMDWEYAQTVMDRWEDAGLRAQTPDGTWADLCLAASGRGPLGPCPWLTFDAASNSVRLSGVEPGPLVGGHEQLAQAESDLAASEAAGEAAYDRMYEAPRPKEAFEDALASLHRAEQLARFLGRADHAEALAARMAHIRAVYQSQFRGW